MYSRICSTILALLVFAGTANAAETTYRQHIKPIMDARCVGCHGADAPEYKGFKEEKEVWLTKGIGPRMDTYSHLVFYTGWPDTGALMRRLDDKKPGNMYQHLGESEEERQKNLALFKSWVGNWSLEKWAESSKEDLDGITVPY